MDDPNCTDPDTVDIVLALQFGNVNPSDWHRIVLQERQGFFYSSFPFGFEPINISEDFPHYLKLEHALSPEPRIALPRRLARPCPLLLPFPRVLAPLLAPASI